VRGKHGWNTWDDYLAVHAKRLQDLEHFIVDDQLNAIPTRTLVKWDGVLYCRDGLELHVEKTQEVRKQGGRAMVRTERYSYHALRRTGQTVINLFRYDNIHQHHGHADQHHRHRYDAAGIEIEPTQHIGEESWPTLSDVLNELHDWWLKRFEVRRRS
jgi:hypothetical protein